MNVSYRWLRSLLPSLVESPAEIAERMAMYGAPVDAVVDVGAPLRDIRIGRVLEAKRHPNADRLTLCRVDAGTGEPLSVVCGAPNVRAGAFYPYAPAGATLPGGLTLERRRIRGELSNGMLCSARELELGRDHEGILELHGEFTPGASFIEAVGLDDARIEIDVTPNRPDLLSHWGVARELARQGESELILPPLPGQPGEPGASLTFVRGRGQAKASGVTIQLEDTHGCPRYIGAVVHGVRVAPSPEWLAARLRTIGLRPINNIVDATNWVLYELGQPLHAFDLNAAGDTIRVRRARHGESLVTLDGESRTLSPDVLVIADAQRPVALAGIMGGQHTEVTDATTDLLLECALFDPKVVRLGRRRLGMTTDASVRFERGVDPDAMERAVRRAIDLIITTAGGTAAGDAAVADAGVAPAPVVKLRVERVTHVLGVPFDAPQITRLLESLGFAVLGVTAGTLAVQVPGHRRYDVAREVDLIEEIARRRGYENFPDEVRPFRSSAVPDDAMAQLEDRLRACLVARGFLESRTMPLVPPSDGDVALLHPLAATESRLRRALLPGLVRRLETNYNRGTRDIRLFEIGTAFATGGADGRPVETTRLAVIFTGARSPGHWTGNAPAFDVWDLRGVIEEIAGALGGVAEPGQPVDADGLVPFDPETIVRARFPGSRTFGAGGRVPENALDAPAWADPIWGAEFTLSTDSGRAAVTFRPLPGQPAVDRDIALVVARSVPAAALEATIRATAGDLLESVRPFDLYEGPGIAAGTRSLAFRLRFRAADRTLTVGEVDALMERILEALRKEHDAERR